jgi:hypothetical protein
MFRTIKSMIECWKTNKKYCWAEKNRIPLNEKELQLLKFWYKMEKGEGGDEIL